MNLDWAQVKANLEEMGLPYQERPAEPKLANFIRQCGYEAHPMIVLTEGLETINADIGVLVTNLDEASNNGVYIFCVLKDNTLGLVTVIPSTISKAPMVRKLVGDITNAVTGIVMPPLTPFDMVEITGQVIQNTVMKNIMGACNIPKGMEASFLCMYLPKFLANVALYHTGAADKDGKPLVNEEIVDMEPSHIRQMLVNGELPDIFKEQAMEKEAGNGDAP